MTPRFTILLPVHRPPALLPYAVETVIGQSESDWELFIICDGAPAATVQAAQAFAARDPRIQAFAFEKGQRLGEAHRHLVLQQARGEFVAQIADDDLWLPHHLRELAALLATVEFGNLAPVEIHPDKPWTYLRYRLDDPAVRERMRREAFNFFGPSDAGYRLSTYRRLPEGWAPAPPDTWTDLHMWRKFLALAPLAAGSRPTVQTLHLAAALRTDMDLAEREAEARLWIERIRRGLRFDLTIEDGPDGPRIAKGVLVLDPSDAAGSPGIARTAGGRESKTAAPQPTGESPPRLRLHVAAFASTLLDIRGRLPSLALAADPALESTFAQGLPIALPAMPVDQPKVLVLQRPFYDSEERMLGDLTHILRNGWLVVIDVDDHPDFIAQQQGRAQVATDWSKFAHVHAVQTSTQALAQAFRARNPEVKVFPNAVFDLPPFPERSGSPSVFYGAANRGPFPAQVAASLKNVIGDNPRTSFVVVHDRTVFDALPTKRKTFHPTLPYEAYLAAMAACDICLSPLKGAPGEDCKSDAKFLDAARGGVLTIASPVVYAETIRDGETGLIAHDLKDWDRQLRIALRNGDKRRAMARAAWEYVRDARMFAAQAAERRDWYLGLWANREALTRDLLARVPALAARLS